MVHIKAKGMGEIPLIGMAAAIRNAVKKACGVSLNEVPLLAEKTLKAIKEAR